MSAETNTEALEQSGKSSTDFEALYKSVNPDAETNKQHAEHMAYAEKGRQEIASNEDWLIARHLKDAERASRVGNTGEAKRLERRADVYRKFAAHDREAAAEASQAVKDKLVEAESGNPIWKQAGYDSQLDYDNRPRG